ncbi:MAG: hypothetical protein JW734_01110 [Candidatus Omnitrophica bacterium]|nr:hypothetical protein [Candidatus Omnitrophota bacterium]
MKGKTKILAVIAVGIIFIFLVERLVIRGLKEKITSLDQETQMQEANLKHNLAVSKRKDSILKEYEEFQGYLTGETQDKKIIAQFLKEVERIAHNSGVSIINLNPDSNPKEEKEYKKFKAELRAELELQRLIDFFHKIQTSSLLIEVDKFSTTAKDEEASLLNLEATISICIP